jgi:hypothetical protein
VPIAPPTKARHCGTTLHDGGLWPVVTPRPGAAGPPSVTEVVGVLDIAALRDLANSHSSLSAAPVSDHVGKTLPAIGIGESTQVALSRIGLENEAAWILTDGRVTGVVHKRQLCGAPWSGTDLDPNRDPHCGSRVRHGSNRRHREQGGRPAPRPFHATSQFVTDALGDDPHGGLPRAYRPQKVPPAGPAPAFAEADLSRSAADGTPSLPGNAGDWSPQAVGRACWWSRAAVARLPPGRRCSSALLTGFGLTSSRGSRTFSRTDLDGRDPVVVGQSVGAFTAQLVAAWLPVDLFVLVAGMIPSPVAR